MPSYQTAMGLIIFGPEKWFGPVAISFNRIKALPMMTEHERRKALGFWGERKALTLLSGAKFVRDLNESTFNHPFRDIAAERSGIRYMIGVKTRNKYTARGALNPTYNIRKKGANVAAIAEQHDAQLAWVAIQVIPERGILCRRQARRR